MKPRLLVAAAFLLLCIVLMVAARDVEGAARGLVIGAALAGMVSLGALIALLVAVIAAGTEELQDRFPVMMPMVYFALGIGAVVLLGGFMLWIAWEGWNTGEVATIARRSSGTIWEAKEPFAYWASVLFHAGAGVFLITSAVSVVIWRWRRRHA